MNTKVRPFSAYHARPSTVDPLRGLPRLGARVMTGVRVRANGRVMVLGLEAL